MNKYIAVTLIVALLLTGIAMLHKTSSGRKSSPLPVPIPIIQYDSPIGPTQTEPYQLESKYIGDSK